MQGQLTPEQAKQIWPYVRDQNIVDYGAGDLRLAHHMLELGAKSITAIDKYYGEVDVGYADPRIQVMRARFEDLAELPFRLGKMEVALVSWPVNNHQSSKALEVLLRQANVVIYLGKNTDGIACGERNLFQMFLRRELLVYEPDQKNVLMVLGDRCLVPRKPTGEEIGALDQKNILNFVDAEAEAARVAGCH
jgi:hypothetical protein